MNPLEIEPIFEPVFIRGKATKYFALIDPNTNHIYTITTKKYRVFPHKLLKAIVDATIKDPKETRIDIDKYGTVFFYDVYTDDFTINNDKMLLGYRFTNSYDRSLKLSVRLALYRLVCENGLIYPQSELQFSFKHSKQLTITTIIESIKLLKDYREKLREVILAAMNSDPILDDYLTKVLTRKHWQRKLPNDYSNEWELYNNVTWVLWHYCDNPYTRHRLLEKSMEVMQAHVKV